MLAEMLTSNREPTSQADYTIMRREATPITAQK